ncbi:MAG: alpha/beta hydrolase-fold protein [Actinomycetota bacterium]
MISPLMAELKESAARRPGDLDRLFDEIVQGGTPLIECIEGDANHCFITFLWRADGAKSVAVVGGPGGIVHNPLHRLGDADVWYRTYKAPADSRFSYQILEDPPEIPQDPEQIMPVMMGAFARMVGDHRNPKRFEIPRGDLSPIPADLVWSVVELKDAPPQPYIDARPERPAGSVQTHEFQSKLAESKRRLWVYTPPGYQPGGDYPWIAATDGAGMMTAQQLPTTLDNLIAEAKIPSMVAVMIEHPGGMPGRVQELACSDIFQRVVGEELVPWVRENYSVSHDRGKAILVGGSFGGLGATFTAWRRPDLFGNVLSNSGSYWWAPHGDEPEWLARELASASAEAVPARCYLDVGRFETGSSFPGVPDLLTTVRHMRNILRAKGSQVFYSEHNGGHDLVCMRGQLAEGLIALAGAWAAE